MYRQTTTDSESFRVLYHAAATILDLNDNRRRILLLTLLVFAAMC